MLGSHRACAPVPLRLPEYPAYSCFLSGLNLVSQSGQSSMAELKSGEWGRVDYFPGTSAFICLGLMLACFQ